MSSSSRDRYHLSGESEDHNEDVDEELSWLCNESVCDKYGSECAGWMECFGGGNTVVNVTPSWQFNVAN